MFKASLILFHNLVIIAKIYKTAELTQKYRNAQLSDKRREMYKLPKSG
jgi:hypothetical protein